MKNSQNSLSNGVPGEKDYVLSMLDSYSLADSTGNTIYDILDKSPEQLMEEIYLFLKSSEFSTSLISGNGEEALYNFSFRSYRSCSHLDFGIRTRYIIAEMFVLELYKIELLHALLGSAFDEAAKFLLYQPHTRKSESISKNAVTLIAWGLSSGAFSESELQGTIFDGKTKQQYLEEYPPKELMDRFMGVSLKPIEWRMQRMYKLFF